MRHRKSKGKLNRFTSWRRATLVSLARALLTYQRITTTLAKAKAVQPLIEKLIGFGKSNSLTGNRRAFQYLSDHKMVSLLSKDIAPRFKDKTSGYTRIMRLGMRRGDNAQMAILELTSIKKDIKKPKKEKISKQQEETVPEAESPQPVEPQEQKQKQKPPMEKKPSKKFLGGLRNIFKKERDSL